MEQVIKKLEKVAAQLENWTEEKTQIRRAVDELHGQVKDLDTQFRKALRKAKDSQLEQFPGFVDEAEAKGFLDLARAVLTKDPSVKAMTEGTDNAGGYLVPDEYVATLIRVIEQYGVARRSATIVPMTRHELNLPSLTAGVTVYWPGEASAITESQPTLGNVGLVAKKLAALVPVSGELMEDSSIALANLLATIVGEAMAAEEDRVAFAGKTAANDPFDGILYASGVTSVVMATGDTDFADVNANYLADLAAAVTSGAASGAKFYMHRTVFNVVRKLKDTQNNYIYAPAGGLQPSTIWGYPFELVEQMPALSASGVSKPFIAFGNLRNLVIGDRKRMTVDASIHYQFHKDLTYLRFMERIAVRVGVPSAFAVLTTAAA